VTITGEAYVQWLDRLSELLDFRQGDEGTEWNCGHRKTIAKSVAMASPGVDIYLDPFGLARRAAGELELPFAELKQMADRIHAGAACDCEIALNCDPRESPDGAEDEGDLVEFIVIKWAADGATTLEEAAAALETYAARLRDLHEQGFTLAEPIDNGHGFLQSPAAAEAPGMATP
jgi:hypothetical protein